MGSVSISTVIPTYNEGERLTAFLNEWAAAGLDHTGFSVTAIVVDDGSAPEMARVHEAGTGHVARALSASGSPHRIEYLRAERNRGKGAAIRLGWSRASPDASWLTFVDGDGAIPARECWRLAATLPAVAADVVCACRIKMAGRTIDRTLFRHLQGRVFATFAEALFHLGFYDTQTGMKAFRGSMIRPLLGSLREDRWLLDIELLVLLDRAGATSVEMPVDCYMRRGSSLVFGLDALRMAVQLVRLRSRIGGRQMSGR